MENGTYRVRNTSFPIAAVTEKSAYFHELDDESSPPKKSSTTSESSDHSQDYTYENGVFEKKKGLSWPITGLFVV